MSNISPEVGGVASHGGTGRSVGHLLAPVSRKNISANAARGVYNDVIIFGPLSKYDHQRYPPVSVDILHGPRHGLSVPSTLA